MKSILILSGGMDSSVLLHHLIDEGHEVDAVSFDYGQRHRRELDAARDIAARLHVRHDIVDLRVIGAMLAEGGSSLLGGSAVPHGHYADESMKATVVPNRNMIMLAIAGGVAVARAADVVAYAAHAGDHAIYPDCRTEFADAVDAALKLCDWHGVSLLRPFVTMTKTDIAARGATLDVPFALTWSCYEGGERHCGKCGTCIERIEAFALAGVADPTTYL